MPLPEAPPAYTQQWDAHWLAQHPGAPNVWSLLESTDARSVLDRVDNGGLFTGTFGRASVRGSWTLLTFDIDGVDVSDRERPGQPLLYPDLGLAGEVSLQASPLSVARPGAGANVGLRLLSPGPTWRRELDAAWTPSTRSDPRLSAWDYEGRQRGHVRVTGPSLAVDGSSTAVQRRAPAHDEESGRVDSLLARRAPRVGTPGLDVAAAWQRVRGAPAPGRAVERSTHLWMRPALGTRWRERDVTAYASFLRADSRTDAPPDVLTHERLDDGPVEGRVAARRSERLRLSAGLRVAPGSRRGHAGIDVSHFRVRRDAASGFAVAETLDRRPARVWEMTAGGTTVTRVTEAGAYAERTFAAWNDRATLAAGARADAVWMSGTNPVNLGWVSVSPVAVATLRLLPPERLVLFGTYVRRPVPPDTRWMSYGDPDAMRADVHRWTDADGDGRYSRGERGPSLRKGGPGHARLDPDLAPPRVTEITVGLAARGQALWIRLAGVRRDSRDLVETIGAPPISGVREVPDPGPDLIGPGDDQVLPVYALGADTSRLLTNPPGLDAYHEGVELDAGVRSGRLAVTMTAAAFRSVGDAAGRGFGPFENDNGSPGERFDDPNADTFARGRLFGDRAYTLKLSGRWRAPGDLDVTATARYQDGQPFARLVIVPDLPQGPDFARAVPNGRHRFTFTETIDVRVARAFGIGARRIVSALTMVNVLGNRRELSEDVRTGPDFRRVATVQPSRAVRFELGLIF